MKFSHFFNFDALPELTSRELLAGVEHLTIAADRLGADEIMTQMYAAGTRREDALRSMELFAREVMPRFA